MKKIILIVDDDRLTLSTAQKLLEGEYKAVAVNSGKQAFKYLERHMPDLILLDINMPEIGGFEVMATLQKDARWCKIPVIFLTADRSAETEIECFRVGACDYISKPFEPNIMLSRIRSTIELDGYRKDLQRRLDEKTKEMERITIQAIMTVANTVDAKDDYTKGHSMRVAAYAELLAQRLGWSDEEIQNIYYVAMLHDVGKIGISDAILLKPGRLTNEEFEIMKTHTTIGCDLLEKSYRDRAGEFYRYCYDICRHHHERWDGRGYPDHLVGDDIPISAQIVAVADVYDALVSPRVYKSSFTKTKAYEMIVNGECGQFSPDILECFRLAKEDFFNIMEVIGV